MFLRRVALKRSPINDNPLRNPGQSLEEAINRLIDEDLACFAGGFVLPIFFAGYEWLRWYAQMPPRPVLITIICSFICAYSYVCLCKVSEQIKQLRMARDGERVVGQYLDRLREDGYHIFHDIIGRNFNIDHVVIGPHGIFTIETKTYSKQVEGKSKICFDGEAITVNGHKPDRDPIVQALAQASWLSEQIKESTGHVHSVQPVVVFPGWFISSPPNALRSGCVWVINPKGLPKFINNATRRLSPEEGKLVAYHLSRYIRTNNKSSHLTKNTLIERICSDGTRH